MAAAARRPAYCARERHSRLRGLRGQLERSHHATDAERRLDVLEPVGELLLLLHDQCRLEALGDLASAVVTCDHRVASGGDHAAQIAQVEVVEVGQRRIGAVEPLGDTQSGEQLLGDREETGRGNLFLALRRQLPVLLGDGLADRGDPALQHALGDRSLRWVEFGEHGIAVGPTGLESLGLGALRQLGRCLEAGTTLTLGALPAGTTLSCLPLASGATLAGRATGTLAALASGAAIVAVATGTTIVAIALGQLLGDRLERTLTRKEFQQTTLLGLGLRRGDRQDRDAVELLLGLGPQHVADRRAGREE